jgi:hypothetical protein
MNLLFIIIQISAAAPDLFSFLIKSSGFDFRFYHAHHRGELNSKRNSKNKKKMMMMSATLITLSAKSVRQKRFARRVFNHALGSLGC